MHITDTPQVESLHEKIPLREFRIYILICKH